MTEKRKFLRFNSSLPIKIASGFSGKTIDLSEMGLSFVLEKPLSSSNAQVKIEFSPKEVIDIEVKVIWNKEREGKFTYGTSFVKLKEEDLFVIKERLSKSRSEHISGLHNVSSLPHTSEILDHLRPSALSVDTNNSCNLRCKHCFWISNKGETTEKTNGDIINSVKHVLNKFPSITNITWYGGEPFIDEKSIQLLKKGVMLKKNNLIITNGTFLIPEVHKNVHVGVSVDGTQEIHDQLRGEGTYNKIKKNILFAIAKGIPVGILYCINAINIDCIPAFLEEWANAGLIEIVFTTYTPIKGKSYHLILNDKQRDKAVSTLLIMKKENKTLISNTECMIELIRAKYGEELARNCPMNVFNKETRVYSIHMCNDGNIRVSCALGKDVSHLHCRSVTKLALYAGKVLGDKESFLSLIKMYHSRPHWKKK